jgi:predicted ferric reductase
MSFSESVMRIFAWLFAANSVQVWWYVTRSAGLVAYLLLWLSSAWGLSVSNRLLDTLLQRTYTYDFHQYISLLAIGFTAIHLLSLTLDHYLPFTLVQLAVPFTSTYRPLWVGIGVISFYLVLLVSITFYIRKRIGVKTFRAIHTLSLVSFAGATIHGFYAGTDSSLFSMKLVYYFASLSVIFLLSYWLISIMIDKIGVFLQSRRSPRMR